MKELITTIRKSLTDRDLLELLAEESAELSQACLKLIRAKGLSNNVTPKTEAECMDNLLEEISDILMVLEVMGIDLPNIENNPKWKRWAKRLKET